MAARTPQFRRFSVGTPFGVQPINRKELRGQRRSIASGRVGLVAAPSPPPGAGWVAGPAVSASCARFASLPNV